MLEIDKEAMMIEKQQNSQIINRYMKNGLKAIERYRSVKFRRNKQVYKYDFNKKPKNLYVTKKKPKKETTSVVIEKETKKEETNEEKVSEENNIVVEECNVKFDEESLQSYDIENKTPEEKEIDSESNNYIKYIAQNAEELNFEEEKENLKEEPEENINEEQMLIIDEKYAASQTDYPNEKPSKSEQELAPSSVDQHNKHANSKRLTH